MSNYSLCSEYQITLTSALIDVALKWCSKQPAEEGACKVATRKQSALVKH